MNNQFGKAIFSAARRRGFSPIPAARIAADARRGAWAPRPLHEQLLRGSHRVVGVPCDADCAVIAALIACFLRPLAFSKLKIATGGGVLSELSPTDYVQWLAAARVGRPVLRLDVENCFGSMSWTSALAASRAAGLEPLPLHLLELAAAAWGPTLPTGPATSPFLAAFVLDRIDGEVRAMVGTTFQLVRWGDDMAVLAPNPDAIRDAYTEALGKHGLALHPKKTRIVQPHRTVQFLGFEISGEGAILPGRQSVVDAMRRNAALSQEERGPAAAGALAYWSPIATAGLNRLRSLHRAAA